MTPSPSPPSRHPTRMLTTCSHLSEGTKKHPVHSPLLVPEAPPLKTPLVLLALALYAFLPAKLTGNITNQFLAKF